MEATGFAPRDVRLVSLCGIAAAAAGITHYAGIGGDVVPFAVSAVALALLQHSSAVRSTRSATRWRGEHRSLQSALGNLPELFVCLFALHSGLY